MISLLLLNENIIKNARVNISKTKGAIISIDNLKTYGGFYSLIISTDNDKNAKIGLISSQELGTEIGPSDIDYQVANVCFSRLQGEKTKNPATLEKIVIDAILEGEREYLNSLLKDALTKNVINLWTEDGDLYFSCGNSWYMVNSYLSDTDELSMVDDNYKWTASKLKQKKKVREAIVEELLRNKENNGVEYSCFIDAVIDAIQDSLFSEEIDDMDD